MAVMLQRKTSSFSDLTQISYYYIIIDLVLTSHVAMFADDIKIYKQIKSREDAAYLQADLLAG